MQGPVHGGVQERPPHSDEQPSIRPLELLPGKLVAKHFNSHHHSLNDLTVLVVEKIHMEDTSFQKMNESHWIQVFSWSSQLRNKLSKIVG